MKKHLILLFCIGLSFFSLGQDFLDKKIDFQVQEVSIPEALDQLSTQLQIDIAYSRSFFKGTVPISVHLKEAPTRDVLSEILAQTTIQFKALGENRVLLFKEKASYKKISGFVEASQTGERLVGAKIYSTEYGIGVITNEYGFFSFQIPKNVKVVFVRSVGYKPLAFEITQKTQENLSIKLAPLDNLPEIIVDGNKNADGSAFSSVNNDQDNITEISSRFVKSLPSLNGQPDFVRVAQMLPSAQGNPDGFTGINIRGGESGQNLMLMDGSPVYIPYHLLGLFSAYNPETVNSMRFVKGNFPARYGGAVSSILDVRIREGDLYHWKGSANVTLLNAGLSIEGPLKKGKGSILLAGRISPRAYFFEESLTRLYFENSNNSVKTRFYDFNIKSNYTLSKKDRVYLSVFSGRDVVFQYSYLLRSPVKTNISSFDLDWHNTVGSFRWNHLYSKSLFSNTTLTYSNYGHRFSAQNEFQNSDTLDNSATNELFLIDSRSQNVDLGFKTDFDYNIGSKQNLRFGVHYNYRQFTPNLYVSKETEILINRDDLDTILYDFGQYYDTTTVPVYYIHETSAYIEDQIKLRRWYFNIGVRFSSYVHESSQYSHLEPRFISKFRVNENSTASLSINKRVQYLHLISNPSIQMPNDLWIPSNVNIKPQELYEIETSYQYKPVKNLKINATAYYRLVNNVYAYPETDSLSESIRQSNEFGYLIRGKGRNGGLEVFADYADEKRGLLFSYVISKAERQFDSLNLGRPFRANFDSRHQFKLAYYQTLNKSVKIGFNWIYNSPRPHINVIQFISDGSFSNLDQDEIGKKNTTLSQPYNRIDINIQLNHQGKKAHHYFQIGVFNVLNTKNIAFHEIIKLDPSNGNQESRPLQSIPILPSVSYRISF